jgi:hypothetical protein
MHERRLDGAVVSVLRGLQLELERERALRVEDRERIQRLEQRLSDSDDVQGERIRKA